MSPTQQQPSTSEGLLHRLGHSGDAEAWELFVSLYGPAIHRHARRLRRLQFHPRRRQPFHQFRRLGGIHRPREGQAYGGQFRQHDRRLPFAGSVILFGLNGANKLTGAVTDDLATDSMSGGAGQDWFFARVTAPADILSDKASNENLN